GGGLRRADPLPPAAAQYPGGGVPPGRGGGGCRVAACGLAPRAKPQAAPQAGAIMPIFDQGYQHWQGPLSGHGWRWLAIARHGVRVQRKNRILRLLVLLAWLPAVALIVAVALWGLVEQQSETVLGLVRNLLPADV